MEVSTGNHITSCCWRCCLALLLCMYSITPCPAQDARQTYSIRDGKMMIELGKQSSEEAIDSFITNFNLFDLDLKTALRVNKFDTLQKLGWKLEKNNAQSLIISKLLRGFDRFSNAADKIIFTENTAPDDLSTGNLGRNVKFGTNNFKIPPFFSADSVVTLLLPGYQRARKVMLAGDFNNWDPDQLAMIKTDSGWVANLRLRPGKYWYKFVVDGDWMTDPNNKRVENDGDGNNNSVLYQPNHVFALQGHDNAKRVYVSGSFNNWEPRQLALYKTATGWQLPVYLAEGTHTYRFVVNGRWMADPANSNKLPNEFNDFNSVVSLGNTYTFQLPGYTNAREVVLAGSFNNWREDELFLQKKDDGWELKYVLGAGNYAFRYRVDGRWVRGGEPEEQDASINQKKHQLLVIGANYTFRVKGLASAKTVYLAGDFNDWAPDLFPMQREGTGWQLPVHLTPGKHTYKLVVDGQWMIDPGNEWWEQNEFGTGNSVTWFDPVQ